MSLIDSFFFTMWINQSISETSISLVGFKRFFSTQFRDFIVDIFILYFFAILYKLSQTCTVYDLICFDISASRFSCVLLKILYSKSLI